MSLSEILQMIAIQSLFCLGVRQLMCEGHLLHFVRRPFENKKEINTIILFFIKPILWCVICFASFWGASAFIFLCPIQIAPFIICCISTAFINRVINDKMDW